MTYTRAELMTLAPWSKGRKVTTGKGPRVIHIASPGAEFWAAWKADKRGLVEAGIKCRPNMEGAGWTASLELAEDEERDRTRAEFAETATPKSMALSSDFYVPLPEGLELRPYQRAGIEFVNGAWVAGYKGALIGDEMGLGKTPQAIGLLNVRPDLRRVVVVGTKSITWQWRRELERWLIHPRKVAVQKGTKDWLCDGADIVILNYALATAFAEKLHAQDWDLVVIDEAHLLSNPDAQRSQAVFGIASRARLALTGTPIRNRPWEFFGLLCWLDPVNFRPAWKMTFGQRYCNAHRKRIGWDRVRNMPRMAWDFSGATHQEELQRRLRASVMIRRLKDEVLTDLPPKVREFIELEADSPAARAAIHGQQQVMKFAGYNLTAKLELHRGEIGEVVDSLPDEKSPGFAEISKTRLAVGLAKVPMVVDYVNERLQADESLKVILFAYHQDVIREFQKVWPTAAAIHGQIKDRDAQMMRFQTHPDCRIIIGNDAMAEGVNLTEGSQVIFAELDWVPGTSLQKEDRAHRYGQKKNVLITYMILTGSMDVVMMKILVGKQRNLSGILNAHELQH